MHTKVTLYTNGDYHMHKTAVMMTELLSYFDIPHTIVQTQFAPGVNAVCVMEDGLKCYTVFQLARYIEINSLDGASW